MSASSVTIVVDATQNEENLERTLNSIGNQTYGQCSVVILCLQGNNTHGLEAYEVVYATGNGKDYNAILAECHTDFVCFVNAGDILAKNYIEECIRTAKAQDADVVIADINNYGDDVDEVSVPLCTVENLERRECVPVDSVFATSAIRRCTFDPVIESQPDMWWDLFLQLVYQGSRFAKVYAARVNRFVPDAGFGLNDSEQLLFDRACKDVQLYLYLNQKYSSKDSDFLLNSGLTQDLLSLHEARQKIVEQSQEISRLNQQVLQTQEHSREMELRVDSLVNSKRYKIGRLLVAPMTLMRYVRDLGFKRTAGIVCGLLFKSGKQEMPFNVRQQSAMYEQYVRTHYPDDAVKAVLRHTKLTHKPLISVIMPTYNTDSEYLSEAIDSVLEQAYPYWQLVIVDDASTKQETIDTIHKYVEKDDRIYAEFLTKNSGIATATNVGVNLAEGSYVALFDHDDLLWPNALFEVVNGINNNPGAAFIYTDEDKVDEDSSHHFEPFFKPDWNPELLRGVNYITHFVVLRKRLYQAVGGEDVECNGAQDWDLFLRATRNVKDSQIVHIAKVLYSWRAHSQSTAKNMSAKTYALQAQEKAVKSDLVERGFDKAHLYRSKSGWLDVVYPMQGNPLISIVIPSKNQFEVLKRCVDSIFERSTYRNFEVIVVDTGSDDQQVLDWYEKVAREHSNFRMASFVEPKFSYSKSCNYGASLANGELLVQLNNDTEVISPNWLEVLAGYAQRPEIGAVGPLLLYPGNKLIQHAGVGVGIGAPNASAGNLFVRVEEARKDFSVTQQVMLKVTRECTAVTAACVVMQTSKFFEVGGFAEEFRVTFNDVDLCLKLREKGYRNVYTPIVRLTHHESISVGVPEKNNRDLEELMAADRLFKDRWVKYVSNDPNYNINLNKERSDFTL